MSQAWYIKSNGKTYGPVTLAKLKQLAAAAKIQPTTELRLGEQGQWLPARNVKGLIRKADPNGQSCLPPVPESETSVAPKPRHPAPETALRPGHPTPANTRTKRPLSRNPYRSPVATTEARPGPASANVSGLKTTRAGLFVIYYGICAVLLATGGGGLFTVLGMAFDLPLFTLIVLGIALPMGVVGYVAVLVGQLMCLTVPMETGGLRKIQTAVALQALTFAFAIAGEVVTHVLGTSNAVDPILLVVGSNILSAVNSIFTAASYVFFLHFMKHVARYIHRQDLASSSTSLVKMVILLAVASFLLPCVGFLAILLGGPGFVIFGIGGIALLITFVITVIRYANLVGYLARAIPKTTST